MIYHLTNMKTYEFRGEIKDGELKLRDFKAFNRAKESLEGEEIFLSLEKWYKKRSDRQNRYYWGHVIDELKKFSGHSRQEIHKFLKKKFLTSVEVLGEDIPGSTKDLDTVEFEEYMRQIRQWASSELNVVIAQPNEAPKGLAYKFTEKMNYE